MVVLHLDRDANTGFPAGYRNQIEIIRADRTVQLAIKAQGPDGKMDRLGWLIAKVAHPIHILRLETFIIRHKSVHLKLVGSISTLHSQTITLSGRGEWPEGTGIDQNFSLGYVLCLRAPFERRNRI